MIELTRFAKDDGPLTKRISLGPDGKVQSDGSACVMSGGEARRVRLEGVSDFAKLIGGLESNQAIALGTLRGDLPSSVQVTTKRNLERINGAARPDLIARTGDHLTYRRAQPALALLDFDAKGMPCEVEGRIEDLGGYWRALVTVVPQLAGAARVSRSSTSAGLVRLDTGEELRGSGGVHVFLLIRDGTDAERFLETLHARCWLAGLGWLMVGAGGQVLERSIVDRMVGAAERLVFEGPPLLEPPLDQAAAARRPMVSHGSAIDTTSVCPPLTLLEKAQFQELRERDAHRIAPVAARARSAFVANQSARLAKRTNISATHAAHIIERQCSGILLPHVELSFDDHELAGTTVADVLADPERYVGATLADPLEGVDYGACKAKIMRRSDGRPWIHSYAHGRTIYELKHDEAAIRKALENAPKEDAADMFVRFVLYGDIDADELEQLRDLASSRSGAGKRVLDAKLKSARKEHASRQSKEERQRQAAERRDPRPRMPAPRLDDEKLPLMMAVDSKLASDSSVEPPMRDFENKPTEVRCRPPVGLHEMFSSLANGEDASKSTRLPAPDMPLLTLHDEVSMAHLIERHIEFYEEE